MPTTFPRIPSAESLKIGGKHRDGHCSSLTERPVPESGRSKGLKRLRSLINQFFGTPNT